MQDKHIVDLEDCILSQTPGRTYQKGIHLLLQSFETKESPKMEKECSQILFE